MNGYYDSGIGAFIHHDDRHQMGDILTDIENAGQAALNTIESQGAADLTSLQNQAISSAGSTLQTSATGQQATNLAIQAGITAAQAKAQSYLPYVYIAGGLLVAYLLFSGGRRYAAPSTSAAASNPRKRRKHRRARR